MYGLTFPAWSMTFSFVLAMLLVSFRSMPMGSFPRPGSSKPALTGLVAALVVLAGCGGGGHKAAPVRGRTVVGQGYRFSAPPSWHVQHSGREVKATSGAVDLVGVTTFPLSRRYELRLWPKVVPALDRAAAQLAVQLGG